MLDALSPLMDGGSIELLADGHLLAVLKLSNPATMGAVASALEFNKIAEEDDPRVGLDYLKQEISNYWDHRQTIIALLREHQIA